MEDDRMARPEVTGRRVIADQLIAAFSIREFCAAHRISQSMYFKLRNMGPRPARDERRHPQTNLGGSRRGLAADA